MVALIITILINLGVVLPGTDSATKEANDAKTSATPTATTTGGTTTWTNGGV